MFTVYLSKMHFLKIFTGVLDKYIQPNGKCLEMFARNLTKDWTSWGNEVLYTYKRVYFMFI